MFGVFSLGLSPSCSSFPIMRPYYVFGKTPCHLQSMRPYYVLQCLRHFYGTIYSLSSDHVVPFWSSCMLSSKYTTIDVYSPLCDRVGGLWITFLDQWNIVCGRILLCNTLGPLFFFSLGWMLYGHKKTPYLERSLCTLVLVQAFFPSWTIVGFLFLDWCNRWLSFLCSCRASFHHIWSLLPNFKCMWS